MILKNSSARRGCSDQGRGDLDLDTTDVDRIAEAQFPSLQTLRACAQSDGGWETLAHAVKISSGGAPLFFLSRKMMLLRHRISMVHGPQGIASSGYAASAALAHRSAEKSALLSIASKSGIQ